MDPILDYERASRFPWSRGYGHEKKYFIRGILVRKEIMDAFRKGEKFPERYGIGLDERCIEYPWLLSRLKPGSERLLDAGSALNHVFIVDQPLFRDKKLHILTLAPESKFFWRKGISYL